MYLLHLSNIRKYGKLGVYDVLSFINKYNFKDETYNYKYFIEILEPNNSSDLNIYSIKLASPYSAIISITDPITEIIDNPLKLFYANNIAILGSYNVNFLPSNYATYDDMLTDYKITIGYNIYNITDLIIENLENLIFKLNSDTQLRYYRIIEFKYKQDNNLNYTELYLDSTQYIIVSTVSTENESLFIPDIQEYRFKNSDKVIMNTLYPLIYYSKEYNINDINQFFKGIEYDINELYDLYNIVKPISLVSENTNKFLLAISRFKYLNNYIHKGVA